MECYYHPERDGTDTCAICGKSICKECGLEIAGKTYCKECLEKIVGLGIENKAESAPQAAPAVEPAPQVAPIEEPVKAEPARLDKQPVAENIYQPQEETYAPKETVAPAPEIKQVQEDSPYKVRDNIEYAGGMESSYIEKSEAIPQMEEKPQNEYRVVEKPSASNDFIYPDHSYEPEPTSARAELEDKYEKYLDDLYFDENVPLGEQLAKDEEEFGSLTRKPYKPKTEEPVLSRKRPENETPEEMEARIRAEILAEKEGGKKGKKGNIHQLNYQEEKEPMSAVDIILTIILIIVILVVIYYLIYVFILHSYYPTFLDSIYALSNPQNVINNILTPAPQ